MKLCIVPARVGLRWVRDGLRVFARAPLAFTGLFFMVMAAAVVLANIPVVGSVLCLVLVPAATVALMSASAQAEQGRFPMPKCRIPDDCIDSKRYPLFIARAVLKELIESLQSTQGVKPC